MMSTMLVVRRLVGVPVVLLARVPVGRVVAVPQG
jgi:hypothetical protein